MVHPLDGARLKVERAREHLEALDREAQAFTDSHRYRLTIERNEGFFPYVLRAHAIDEKADLPLHLGLIAGDVIHNLRSALDHVTNAVASPPVGTGPGKKTQFPLYFSEAEYGRDETSVLRGVPVDERTRFRELQPYHVMDLWPNWPGPLQPRHLNLCLMALGRLDNLDKHRLLLPVNAMTTFKQVRLTNVRRFTIWPNDGGVRVEDKAILLRFTELELLAGASDVQVQPQPTFSIMFGDSDLHVMDLMPTPTKPSFSWPGRPDKALASLGDLHRAIDAVAAVVDSFVPVFANQPVTR